MRRGGPRNRGRARRCAHARAGRRASTATSSPTTCWCPRRPRPPSPSSPTSAARCSPARSPSRAPAMCSARSPTWPPSRSTAPRSAPVPTSTRSRSCCMRRSAAQPRARPLPGGHRTAHRRTTAAAGARAPRSAARAHPGARPRALSPTPRGAGRWSRARSDALAGGLRRGLRRFTPGGATPRLPPRLPPSPPPGRPGGARPIPTPPNPRRDGDCNGGARPAARSPGLHRAATRASGLAHGRAASVDRPRRWRCCAWQPRRRSSRGRAADPLGGRCRWCCWWRRPGPHWLAAGLAPVLGLVGLAGAFPALAGQLARWRSRALLGALGYWWLRLAALPLDLVCGEHRPRLVACEAWLSVVSCWLGMALWALAAAVLPWVVRGRFGAARRARCSALWAVALVAGWGGYRSGGHAFSRPPRGGATLPSPPGVILSASLGALLAVAARALRGPVRTTLREEPQVEMRDGAMRRPGPGEQAIPMEPPQEPRDHTRLPGGGRLRAPLPLRGAPDGTRPQARPRDGRAPHHLRVARVRPQRVRRLALPTRPRSLQRCRGRADRRALRLPAGARSRRTSRLASHPLIAFHTDESLSLGEFGIQARLVRPEGGEGGSNGELDARARHPDAGGGQLDAGEDAWEQPSREDWPAPPPPSAARIRLPRPAVRREDEHGQTMIYSSSARLREPLEQARAARPPRALLLVGGRRLVVAPEGAVIAPPRLRRGARRRGDLPPPRPHPPHRTRLGDPRTCARPTACSFNGERLHGSRPLQLGDRIELGSTEIVFEQR